LRTCRRSRSSVLRRQARVGRGPGGRSNPPFDLTTDLRFDYGLDRMLLPSNAAGREGEVMQLLQPLRRALLTLLGLGMCLLACGDTALFTFTDDDNGKEVSVSSGSTFQVRLDILGTYEAVSRSPNQGDPPGRNWTMSQEPPGPCSMSSAATTARPKSSRPWEWLPSERA
jgi:hypothetical protein